MSLDPLQRVQLPLAKAARDVRSAYPLHINRLAIDSKIVLIEVDGITHRFETQSLRLHSGPPMDFWSGKSSGGRAEITRTIDSMTGSIDVDGRRFGFGGPGEYVVFFERELHPRPMTPEEKAEEEARIALAKAQIERYRREALAAGGTTPTPSEECAQLKDRDLLAADKILRLPQPAHLRRWAELQRDAMRERARELDC